VLCEALVADPALIFAPHIKAFLMHARQRGSVLEERGGVYRFIHLAFQEFLVARYLREVSGAEGREAILAELEDRLADPWWREPILLLVGYMAGPASKAARDLLARLEESGASADARFAAAELAAPAALEWRESGEALRGSCAARIVRPLSDPGELQGSRPILRARAGDALSRLGDPRFDPRRFSLPADDWLGLVHIPGDPRFRIGTASADAKRVAEIVGHPVRNDEINDASTPTGAFYIARHPVTVAQVRAFVEATGFALDEPVSLREPGSRPVRSVSWHEALAYCDWLTRMLAESPLLASSGPARLVRESGWRVTLPSELEWEKAARGGQPGAVYPWGDTPDPNRANHRDTGIGDTSVVRCFPANAFGLHDMAGNVWEWTRSLWGRDPNRSAYRYPYNPGDSAREPLDAGDDTLRVVRGGSWLDPRGDARCAYRLRSHPEYRGVSVGFRVVLRSAPVG
jgi:formylglycine-generating enzyme required for sulfatase activity